MANSILFDSCTFTMSVPKEFDSFNLTSTEYTSKYNVGSTTTSTLHAPTLRAILAYMRLSKATTDGDSVDGLGAIGVQNDKKIVAEYIGGRKDIQAVVYTKNSGGVIASVYINETAPGEPFVHKSIKGGKETGTAFFFTLMPIFMEDEEFKECYDELYNQFVSGFSNPDVTEENIFKLCDNVYRRVENPDKCGDVGVKIDIPKSNIRSISEVALTKGTYSVTDILLGEFKKIKPGMKPKKRGIVISAADFTGKYKMSEREFNDKERALIPEIPDWYLIPEEVETICNYAQKTTGSQMPMRNFMLRGAAGSGKTEGAKAVAAGLGLQYMFLTCSADDEKFDFIGQILPNIEGIDFVDAESNAYIPTIAEIDEDPVGAYYNMTGEFKAEITADKVKDEIERMAKEKSQKKEKDFRYVYTPLIEAIRKGYVIEIQEPTVISKQGVLVGLNSLLDNCKAIKLITGEVIERHPDTVIILTTNTDYNGCKELNQSIVSRMNLIFDMNTPDAATMAKRAMGITGCSDGSIVKKMAETIEKIIKKCSEELITDGSCGMRELISWVQSYMICEDAAAAAEYTVLASATADAESRESIRSTCISPVFDTM